MAENRKDEQSLRDSEIAMVDALKLLMEVLVVTGTVKAEVFERVFAQQRDGYIAKEMPNAAVIMEVLRGFAAKPAGGSEGAPAGGQMDEPQGSA